MEDLCESAHTLFLAQTCARRARTPERDAGATGAKPIAASAEAAATIATNEYFIAKVFPCISTKPHRFISRLNGICFFAGESNLHSVLLCAEMESTPLYRVCWPSQLFFA